MIAFVMQFVDAIAKNSTQYRGDDQVQIIALFRCEVLIFENCSLLLIA